MTSVAELRLDEEELRKFVEAAERPRVKDLLMIQLRILETEIAQKQREEIGQKETEKSLETDSPHPVRVQSRLKTVDIKTYAWDQSEKFMKIYATVEGVQDVPKEQLKCSFTDRSFSLQCEGVGGKNYSCQVTNLHDRIVPEESYFKIKTNTVLIMLKKKNADITWPYVTKRAEKDKPKKSDFDDTKDPSESLMNMMKKMYEDGDDEMKRTIAKAWTESREKSTTDQL